MCSFLLCTYRGDRQQVCSFLVNAFCPVPAHLRQQSVESLHIELWEHHGSRAQSTDYAWLRDSGLVTQGFIVLVLNWKYAGSLWYWPQASFMSLLDHVLILSSINVPQGHAPTNFPTSCYPNWPHWLVVRLGSPSPWVMTLLEQL